MIRDSLPGELREVASYQNKAILDRGDPLQVLVAEEVCLAGGRTIVDMGMRRFYFPAILRNFRPGTLLYITADSISITPRHVSGQNLPISQERESFPMFEE